MSDKPNITAAKGFFAAQHCGDLDDAFANYVHPDFSFVVSCVCNDELRAAIPWAGYEHRGREGYRRLTALLFSEYELLAYETTRFTDAGTQVFVEGHFRLRHQETARIADSDFLARFEMRNGKIVGGQMYESTSAVAAAAPTERNLVSWTLSCGSRR
ncbi:MULTISPECIES: nuclear transport factor 2 family protein [Rhizobium]|uniref:Ketosteroid isomerase-like protein n=1 Tax=Rhizobium laguerreae TaxID=1076926 RepID=A0ABR6GAD0_9HYPH|nr:MULTISPECIES: nuclear transport factor 2 family protein [Rhizobium]KAF5882129.1 nuclear transport factor 2 family protein [Rhizobium sp. PEPV16]MBB3163198.1 ketosteroid isomerase-like protein [Rhizobium laguerreae]NKM16281.1 ketosteroid isomerase [Rhizobium laguerreae]OOO42962.1 ketosteroid isomerase [Rhizobium laguerreae]